MLRLAPLICAAAVSGLLMTVLLAAVVSLLLTRLAVGPLPSPAVPQAQPETAPMASGGLGLPLEAIHARYGTGELGYLGEAIPADHGQLIVSTAPNGKVDTVERTFDPGVSFEEARTTGLQMIPVDAVLEQTYVTEVDAIVDVFASTSLAAQFPETVTMGTYTYATWPNGEPGQFIIGYAGYDPTHGLSDVTEIVLELGNHPF